MKKYFIASLLVTLLCSCSLFQRHGDEPDGNMATEEASAPEEKVAEQKAVNTPVNAETEVARLTSRVEALETRIDILAGTLEKSQMRASQPVISAEPEASNVENDGGMKTKYTAPKKDSSTPTNMKKTLVSSKEQQEVEHNFQEGMQLFQAGKNAEASSKFATLAKQHEGAMLASHALYWAGEASARSQKWSNAVTYWEDIEKNHPRSAYLPEALAGLSKAYDAQGNMQKASYYKTALVKSFPQAPATLNFTTHTATENNSAPEAAESSEEEKAPTDTATKVDE